MHVDQDQCGQTSCDLVCLHVWIWRSEVTFRLPSHPGLSWTFLWMRAAPLPFTSSTLGMLGYHAFLNLP